jgi:hypothetical protein
VWTKKPEVITKTRPATSKRGSVAAVWSSVLGLAFFAAFNPVRLGFTLLVISRSRPVQNLFAFWVGCLTGSIFPIAIPLTLLHVTPMLRSLAQNSSTPATHSTIRHLQIGIGALALSIAALLTVRLLVRRRAQLPKAAGKASTAVLDLDDKPTAITRLLGRAQGVPTEDRRGIWRLLGRARDAWENGSLWVAWLIGQLFGGLPPGEALMLFAIFVTSEAAIGTQVSASIAYVIGMLAFIEIVLVSYLATPAKTYAMLLSLHDWVSARRRQILVAIFAVVGVSMLARGMGKI